MEDRISLVDIIMMTSALLYAILTIVFFCLLLYLVYWVIQYGYPRPFNIGHSEPFAKFMEGYMEALVTHLKQQATLPGVSRFLQQYKQTAGSDLLSSTSYGPNDVPCMYIICIFYNELANALDSQHELSLIDKFIDRSLVDKYYEPGRKHTIGVATSYNPATGKHEHGKSRLEPLVQLRQAFQHMRESVANEKSKVVQSVSQQDVTREHVSIHLLDMLLNRYLDKGDDNIVRSYNLRKSGGRSTVLLKMYMKEHSEYIFKEKIKIDVWSQFGAQVKFVTKLMQDAVASPTVYNFMMGLPMKLAGVEGFAPHPEEEVEEHFIGALMAIAKVFVALFKIVIAVVSVISDPLKFIQWILGLIIGVILAVLYLLVLLISVIFIVPAGLWVLSIKIWLTIVWTALFLLISIFFVVAQLLDLITGGAILGALRCENLPNAWHTVPNFVNDNRYRRTFLCSSQCAARYYPTGSLMCKKQPAYEPSFCPQQLIYNAFMNNMEVLKNKPYTFHYVPTIEYYRQSVEQRKQTWSTMFDKRRAYIDKCNEAMQPYDEMVKAMCTILMKDRGLKEDNPRDYNKLLSLCKLVYCNSLHQMPYCDQAPDLPAADPASSLDLLRKTIHQFIVLVSIIIIANVFLNFNPDGI